VVTASRTVTTEAPQVAIKPAGQDPESADRALQARTVTLCWRHKSSPFWIILLLVSGRAQHQMTHPTPKCMDGPISPMIRRVVSKSPTRKAPPAPPALQLSLFDERDLAEIESPEFPGERLVVCKNPALQDLKDIQARIVRKRQPLRGADKIGLAVGALLGCRKVAKHFRLAITDAALSFTRDHAAIATEAALDGFYVLRTNVPADALNAADTVRAYKSLAGVERAFRSLKTVDLDIRPIFHWVSPRVRAHVFLCMLAYHLEWHMRQALAPILFDDHDRAAGEALRTA